MMPGSKHLIGTALLLTALMGCAGQYLPDSRDTEFTQREVDLGHFFPDIAPTDACFVLLDMGNRSITRHNALRARTQFLPGSTFKIPNALIALETGVAPDADFELPWDPALRPATGFWARSWSREHTLRSALQHSVYWYYQEIARRIGAGAMQRYLDQFAYGNRSMAGGLDRFWLHGGLRISADEQVQFLRRLYFEELGVSPDSTDILKDILVLENAGDYRISGKTGTVNVGPDRELAWLVGYLEYGERRYFFALNVEGEVVWERWGGPGQRLQLVRSILGQLLALPLAQTGVKP
ncbi:MAG: penicillin-binding transpeptidase domain-containing protein [Xanthomonadales bacterium]|nr:penicillin-binding transpeptidase domain-containing protein [Xanthomonadales bacterium]